MAVGGISLADLDFEEIDNNIQEQNDEILALQAIFEGEDDRLVVLSSADETELQTEDDRSKTAGNMLQLFVPVRKEGGKISLDVYQPWTESKDDTGSELSDNRVTLSRSESGQRVIWSFEVTYLSPLCLYVTLPLSYPSMDPPSYVISCPWLSPGQLSAVCLELDRLWAENKTGADSGMPILYTWLDWLQENILSFLGLDNQISLTEHKLDEDVDDCRVLIESEDINNIVTSLLRYNQQEEMKEFSRMDHECGICFDIQTGSKFFLIPQCKHPVCGNCMKEHCQILVKDGSVLSLGCPHYECKSSIPPYIIQQVLPQEQFQRFEKLALQKCLDVMGDIVWCPRCSNPVILEPEDNLAHCISCFYSFCARCGEKWHPGENCKGDEEELERMRQEMLTKKVKDEDERKENLRRAKQLEEEGLSYSYISSYVSHCPSCRAKIMKIGGSLCCADWKLVSSAGSVACIAGHSWCNKVTCTNCHRFMCWTCQKPISGYDHFSDNPRCNTFSMNENFDNADMPQLARYGLYHNPPPRPAPPQINQGRIILNMIKANPELANNVMVCLNCRQKNLREDNNNHIRCYNCKTSLCFDCKGKIVGPVGKHFSGVNSCRQHSYS